MKACVTPWATLVLLALTIFVPSARAAPCSAGDTSAHSCVQTSCKGVAYCEGPYLGACEPTGESTVSCSVCGRTGYQRCLGFNILPGSCSAYQDELCNGCDDDGDGTVDEGWVGAP